MTCITEGTKLYTVPVVNLFMFNASYVKMTNTDPHCASLFALGRIEHPHCLSDSCSY